MPDVAAVPWSRTSASATSSSATVTGETTSVAGVRPRAANGRFLPADAAEDVGEGEGRKREDHRDQERGEAAHGGTPGLARHQRR